MNRSWIQSLPIQLSHHFGKRLNWYAATCLIVISLFLIAWIAVISSIDRRLYQEHVLAQSNGATLSSDRDCNNFMDIERINCFAETATSEYRRDRGEYLAEIDTYAQRSMALWTSTLGVVGILTIPISIIGIGLLILTLRETQASTSATKRVAELEMPYLDVKLILNEAGAPKDMQLENSGRTPAAIISICRQWAYKTPTEDLVIDRDVLADNERLQSGIDPVQPKEPSRTFSSFLEGWPPKNPRKSVAYCYGLIQYRSRDDRDEWVQYYCLSRNIGDKGSFGAFNGKKEGRYREYEYNSLVRTKADGLDITPPPSRNNRDAAFYVS